jgi:hypothetical protein
MFCSLQRLKANFQVRLPVDLRDSNIQCPLTKFAQSDKVGSWMIFSPHPLRLFETILMNKHKSSSSIPQMAAFPHIEFDASSQRNFALPLPQTFTGGEWIAFHGTSSVFEGDIDQNGIESPNIFNEEKFAIWFRFFTV